MLFVYLLACIGLLTLLGLAAAAVFGPARRPSDEPDAFDLALSAVARLQGAAWRAVQELRELDGGRKGEK